MVEIIINTTVVIHVRTILDIAGEFMDDFMEASQKQGYKGGIPIMVPVKDGQVLAADITSAKTVTCVDCLRNAGRIGTRIQLHSNQCLVIFALGQLSSLGLRKSLPVNLRLSWRESWSRTGLR